MKIWDYKHLRNKDEAIHKISFTAVVKLYIAACHQYSKNSGGKGLVVMDTSDVFSSMFSDIYLLSKHRQPFLAKWATVYFYTSLYVLFTVLNP